MSEIFHGTTIISVRRGKKVAVGGDGQVTFGNIVLKSSARKGTPAVPRTHSRGVRRRHRGRFHIVRALRG
jgi:hypothetical protein